MMTIFFGRASLFARNAMLATSVLSRAGLVRCALVQSDGAGALSS